MNLQKGLKLDPKIPVRKAYFSGGYSLTWIYLANCLKKENFKVEVKVEKKKKKWRCIDGEVYFCYCILYFPHYVSCISWDMSKAIFGALNF